MLAMPGLRAFSVSVEPEHGRVSCGTKGLFVGNVPLLQRQSVTDAYTSWTVRPSIELNNELTACYRLPVDIASKANALALIAHAFNRGDLAMAAIAAVQMQLPNPPTPSSEVEPIVETAQRAGELRRSGLLKFWDPAKHPRTGAPPNPGWFAPTSGGEPKALDVIPVSMVDNKPGTHTNEDLPTGGAPGIGGGIPSSTQVPIEPPAEAPEPETQQPLPFPGGLPPQLAPYRGGKTYGIFETPTGDITVLQSGYDGPASEMPSGSSGFDGVTLGHVEGHAAALMRQEGIMEATLRISKPEICESCTENLPRMLPPGATLHVILPDGTEVSFIGIGP